MLETFSFQKRPTNHRKHHMFQKHVGNSNVFEGWTWCEFLLCYWPVHLKKIYFSKEGSIFCLCRCASGVQRHNTNMLFGVMRAAVHHNDFGVVGPFRKMNMKKAPWVNFGDFHCGEVVVGGVNMNDDNTRIRIKQTENSNINKENNKDSSNKNEE